ncbi:unnamed protein product [Closterium sp. Naga37s-1]|nr:unnamed protein product [Closterium sp. Naga37s-1]
MNGGNPCAEPPFLGVQCDSEGRVQSISLVNRDLVGSVPDELSQVNELISLNLDQNKLTGGIPNTLNNLVHLQSASICCNLLSGQIPDLSPMTALNLLHLDGNFLQDAIPESLANLLQLKDLQLNNNHLSGTVPSVLGNLQALTVLRLDHNYLSGTLPSSLSWLVTTPNAVFNFTENLSDFCGPAGLGVPLCPDDPNYVPPGTAAPPSAPPSEAPPSSPSPSPVPPAPPAPPAPSGGEAPPSNPPPAPTPDSSGSSNLSPSDSASGGGNSSSSNSSSSSGGGGVSIAVIAGVAGGVAALSVMGLFACYCLRARKRKTVVNAAAGGAAGGTGEAAEMMEKGQGGSAGKAGAAARIASIKKASASAEGGASGRRGVGGSGRGGADAAPGAVDIGAGAQANSRPSPITITVEKAGAATGDVTAPLISATGGTASGGGGGGAGAAAGAVAGVAAAAAAVGVGAAVAASQDKRKSSPKEPSSIRGSSSARSSTDGEEGGGASASGRNGRPLPPGMSWSKGSGRKFVDESDEEDNLSNQKFFPPPPPPPLISPPSSSPPSASKASAAAAAAGGAGGAGGGKSPFTPPQPLPPLTSTPSSVAASLEKQSSPRPPLPPPPSFGHKQPASPRRLSGDSPKAAADASAAVASAAGPGSGTSSPGAVTGAGAGGASKAGGNTAAAAAAVAAATAAVAAAGAAASSPKARSSSPSRPAVVIPPVVPLPTLKSLNSGKNPRGALGLSGASGAAAGNSEGDAADRNRGKEAERGGEKGKAGSEKPSAPAAVAVGVAYGNAGRALRAADLDLDEKGAGGSATGDGSSVGGDDDGSDTGGAAGSGAAASAAAAAGGAGAGLGRAGVSRGKAGSGRELGSPGAGGGGTWAGGSDAASEASEESGKGGWERAFSFSELALATNDFGARGQRNVVGQGRNGTVYKARLPDGTTVAVKRLSNNNPDQTVREFRFEADAMAHARHPNVVALLGCCAEGDERMLISEFVPNGSLELWLHGAGAGAGGGAFGAGPAEPMEWPLRVHVALGCARGLAYLHEGTDVRVVHRDVKASNVLLDAQWNPKLGDFALAKIMAKEQTHAATRVVGTYGYVAPEYLNTGILTERSDVYSYGVLLLELVTGRRPIDNHLPPEQVDVVRWVKRLAAEERVGEALDPRIAGTVPADDVEYVVGIALRCIDANALKRPRMKQIVHMLESEDPALRDGWVAKRPTPASAKALRDSSPSWYHRNAASDSPAAPSSAMAISRASPRGSSPRFGGAGPGIPAPGSARAAGTRHTDMLRSGSPRNFVGGATGSSPKAADIGGMIASAAMKAGVVGGSPRAGGYIGYSPTRSGGAVPVSPPSARNGGGGGGGGASAGGGSARVGASPPKVPAYAQGGSPSAARLGGVGMGAGGMRGGSPGERAMAQPRKFLVAVDDSEVSAYAFTWAITNLFRPADSALVLTAKNYAADMPLPTADIAAGGARSEYAVPLVAPVSPEEQLAVEERARALVDKYMRQCEQAKVVSEGEVVQGDPGPHIVSEAARVAADALVLGSHGRGILGRTFLGSISDYVRHHSTVPVVIVRQPKAGEAAHDALTSSGMARRIVVAVDESSEAEFAFAWAMRHVVRDGDRLTVLHVQNPIAAPTSLGIDQFGMEDVYMPPDTSNRANVRALDDSEKLVERFMGLVAASSKAECEGRVVMGPTEERLVEELKQLTADLAVVGTRDHDVISRTTPRAHNSSFLIPLLPRPPHTAPFLYVPLPPAPSPIVFHPLIPSTPLCPSPAQNLPFPDPCPLCFSLFPPAVSPCPLVVAKMPKPASRPGSTQASPRDSHQHAI